MMQNKLKWIEKNAQNSVLIKKINFNELESSDIDCTNLKDCKQIASYSWSTQSSKQKPLIYIPGKAKILKNDLDSLLSEELRRNTKNSVVDMNRLYLPNYPMEPIFRSISLCSPNFDFSGISFISDRNNIRKLFNLVDRKASESFIIDLERIGNFILMVRREKSPIAKNNSYGEDFEKKACISQEDYSGHRIITSYGFGDHQFLIRFEVDCVQENEEAQLQNLDITNDQIFGQFKKLWYIQDGIFKPKDLVELTTKSGSTFPKQKWAQMFFSQTNNLVIGNHSNGVLNKIRKLNFDQINQLLESRKDTQPVLGKFNNLLNEIKNIVLKSQLTYRLVYNHVDKSLTIYQPNSYRSNLPNDIMNQFTNKKDH